MALRNIFKKKPKEKPKRKVEPEKELKKVKPSFAEAPEDREEKPIDTKTQKVKKGTKKITGVKAYRILKEPHISEKTTNLADKNQYVFKIWPRANKTEVKKAIRQIFGVDVLEVKIINIPKKKRRLGKVKGFRKGYKKAIIKIKKGQKIEIVSR